MDCCGRPIARIKRFFTEVAELWQLRFPILPFGIGDCTCVEGTPDCPIFVLHKMPQLSDTFRNPPLLCNPMCRDYLSGWLVKPFMYSVLFGIFTG